MEPNVDGLTRLFIGPVHVENDLTEIKLEERRFLA